MFETQSAPEYRPGSSTDCTEGSLTRSLGCLLSRAVIKRLQKIRLKGYSKGKSYATPYSEADRRFLWCLTKIFSTGANGRNKPHKQSFKSWWTDSAKEKLQTNMYNIRETDFIGVFLLPCSMAVERVIN